MATGKLHAACTSSQAAMRQLCFVWDRTTDALKSMLDRVGVKIIEGPAPRQGGRKASASSVYARDPDGNLLKFMIYR